MFCSQDFRTKGGLYDQVKKRHPKAFVTGRDLFSSWVFNTADTTSLFYAFICELKVLASVAEPSPTHWFIKKLEQSGKLVRSYTQNIDGMERRVGIACSSLPVSATGGADFSRDKILNVQLHGDLHRLICRICKSRFDYTHERLKICKEGGVPLCPECGQRGEIVLSFVFRCSSSTRADL